MASKHNLYTCNYKGKVTSKLSFCGYTYTRNKVFSGKNGDTWYFICDQRNICKAKYTRNPDGTWKQGKDHWTKSVHSTHQPNFDRTEAEMARGRLRDFGKQFPELPAAHLMAVGIRDVSLSAQVRELLVIFIHIHNYICYSCVNFSKILKTR